MCAWSEDAKRRAAESRQRTAEQQRPTINWDNQIARLRAMLDKLDRKRDQ